ncbi:amino acid ABC transporter permease [Methanococcus voltae]|uniref:Polar amino acid ABC transporter, inner membrane subunit n=1 Tax=Methanococcus voltae (strain ATCC BAA-1334 / A3) TaxID=456320 RepID=D7DRT2_METV3|nr:amino acid ABC transporter permease [Methanococcus voltae]MCS3901160.1 polar amino acid transport system permease protein [Methanococcus voltae]
MNFDVILLYNLPALFWGLVITLKIAFLSFIFAVIIAHIVGILRALNIPKPVDMLFRGYVEIFRGVPLLILLFFIYYGLPSIGIVMDNTTAAVLGLSLNGGAYISEIVRASLLSIPKGQWDACSSLGMSKVQSLIYVIIPQTIRISMPSLMNSFSAIIKESSLVSVIAITELTRVGQLIYTKTSSPFEVYIVVAIIYLSVIGMVSLLSDLIEKRLNYAYTR